MVYVQVYEPSIFSIGGPGIISNYAKKIAGSAKVETEIKLDAHNDKQHTYTTGEAISGKAIITSTSNVQFDEIQITLEGQTRVALEQMSQVAGHSTIEASHTFLKLNMPIPASAYPHPRILEAGETNILPWNFVIPNQLLPQACTHKCVADHVHDAHMQLPPTMGGHEKCDLTPDMGRVHYFVAVKVLRSSPTSHKSIVLNSVTRKIRVMPVVPESPPLHISPADTEYQLIRTKKVRKGMFKGKLGEVTFEAKQPQPFIVTPDAHASQSSITAPLSLTFNPATPQSKPPKIGTLTAKIKTSTFASVKAQKDLAKRVDHLTTFDPTRGIYTQTTSLATMTLDSTAPWKWVADAPVYARRDSGYSTNSDSELPEPASDSSSGHYEAQILVPLTLPDNRTWLPTFHSCLVSRLYGLEFNLSLSAGSGSSIPTSSTLRVPIQVVCAKTNERRPSVAQMDVDASVDETLRPRLLSVPDVQFVGNSALPGVGNTTRSDSAVDMELPPGYGGGFESYVRRESAAEAQEMGFA